MTADKRVAPSPRITPSPSVASPGWLTPGAASDECVTPSPLYFFLKNLATFFVAFCLFTRVSPLGVGRCHPAPFFYLSDLVSPLFFVILPTIFFLRVSLPLEGVTRGGPPRSDATVVTDISAESHTHAQQNYYKNKFILQQMQLHI